VFATHTLIYITFLNHFEVQHYRNYCIKVTLNGSTCLPFHENPPIGSNVISGGHADRQTDTHRHDGDLISQLSFFESRLKNNENYPDVKYYSHIYHSHIQNGGYLNNSHLYNVWTAPS
jgi:hypothetical protein